MATVYDYQNLRNLMEDKGYSVRRLSEESKIPLATLSDKLNNRSEFKGSEIQLISQILEIDQLEPYFFVQEVRNNEQSA